MNLADIRKKAQKGEMQWGPNPAAGQVFGAPTAHPEPPVPGEQPEMRAMAESAARFGQPEPMGLPADFGFEQHEIFDPAAVILEGRHSSSLSEEGSQQEDLDAASVELLCFKVADEEYAISIMNIKEIIKPREVTEVPRVPPFVRGILSLRGNIIPVFDMRVRLGLSGAASCEHERIVVVKRQNGFCGVLVDEVVQVVRIAEAGIEPPPVVLEGVDRDFVQGIGRVAGRMLILLDMEKVLDVSLL